MPVSDLRFAAFCVVLVVYALFGSPTADHPGFFEWLMAVLMVLSAGVFTMSPAFPLLVFGLVVPVVIGAVNGNEGPVMLRDLAGFLFLCLPVFYSGLLSVPHRQRLFIQACLFIGLVFSLRTLGVVYGYLPVPGELLYLANSPLVLFSALFMIGRGFDALAAAGTIKNFLFGVLWMAGAILPMAAMLVDVQRVGFAAITVTILFYAGRLIWRHPVRAIVPCMIILAMAWLGWQSIETVYDAVMTKTSNVGLNMRLEEARAVFAALSGGAVDVALGKGWGATLASPAVGGVTVSFTHSLLTYLMLKAGIFGLCLAGFYLVSAGRGVWRHAVADPAIGAALIWPLVIPVFLYASHKSLDFGLILTLALLPVPRRVV
jgi:hypothetical protein